MMQGNMTYNVATGVAILDRLPANERPAWILRLNRVSYHYIQQEGGGDEYLTDKRLQDTAQSLRNALGELYALRFSTPSDNQSHLQVHLHLNDGSPLTIDLALRSMPFIPWFPVVLVSQLILLLCTVWFAIRSAVRPLTILTQAAESMNPHTSIAIKMPEEGPVEVRKAACAFNAMQERIAAYLQERMHILAAISHDLQTPITRIKLRSELIEDNGIKIKLLQDLEEMNLLIREGVSYASTNESSSEKTCRVQPHALVDSLVCDYQDTGQPVMLLGKLSGSLLTKPLALRRTLSNVIDNALKFAGSAEVVVKQEAEYILIQVQDQGPGIPPDELYAVMQPFYRVENSRNRMTGGTGLGLAIAQQLVTSLNGSLTLTNRVEGGLVVKITLSDIPV
ncbi:ATP-binding protein [Iodobacter sp.]|uniref:ATP-binding protein n=1 Tax=Iodobacter sp. TaxID=1915058 RepID=UPI0025E09B27|nr:ATP-binding protein [Iodobacter sp.]